MNNESSLSRRQFLERSALAGVGLLASQLSWGAGAGDGRRNQARIAITLDCEMSRNFPVWEDTHWDFEKGNLNDAAKQYCVDAAKRVKARGGVIHFFMVARVLEQENVDWAKELIAGGHPIGNHTYDHVNLLSKKLEDVQFRFKRAPWLVAGKTVPQVLRENIELATKAMQARLGITPAGFRTPGGFADGLRGREDLQRMLMECGFSWVSSMSPTYPTTKPGQRPDATIYKGLVETQPKTQPFIYPTGLVEVPMSAISDIGAFRGGRWPLDDFIEATRMGVTWAIENGAVFDLLSHPSCLGVVDPTFRTIDMICDLVEKSRGKAVLVNLDTLAREAKDAPKKTS